MKVLAIYLLCIFRKNCASVPLERMRSSCGICNTLNNGGTFSDFAQKIGKSSELSGYAAATKVVDVVATAGANRESDGLYHVSFSGVTLKDGMTVNNVYGLHFVSGAWELMRPLSIDTRNNTVIFGFSSFSPFMIAT